MPKNSLTNLEILNQGFIAAQENISDIIEKKARLNPTLWRSKIGRGNFIHGQGYTKKTRTFHEGQAIQGADRAWDLMEPSRAPGTNGASDPGYDACTYTSPVIGYGLEEKSFALYQTTRRTMDICLNDILYQWQFKQQLTLMYNMLASVTLGEWENWTRERYIDFTTPFLADAHMTEISIPNGADTVDLTGVDISSIGTLHQTMLDKLYMYLYRQVPGARIATDGGMPVYGLVSSAETLKELISANSTAREEFLYGNPNLLIEGIGNTKSYKHFSHIMDPMSVRYTVDPANPSTLKRVWPYTSEPTTVGDAINVTKEYVEAPFELSVIFLKDVMRTLIPSASPTSLNTRQFGKQNNVGVFQWINIKDRETNLLGEKGFYFAKFQAAAEPLSNSDQAISILHRRCTDVTVQVCNTCDASASGAQDILTIANYDSDETVNTQIEVLLAACLDAGVGAEVTVTEEDESTTHTGYIVDDSGEGWYRIDFGTLPPDEDDWVSEIEAGTAGAATVEVA